MINNIKISFPIVDTFKKYQKSWLKRDFIAGVTVAAVAVPQAIAYAQLAGSPLIAGLYAALIGMLIFAVFSTSRFVIVGPDAALAAMSGATLIPLAAGDAGKYASLLAVLAILIGVVCLLALFARLGVIADFISRPILLGYMAGLALAVIASQAPKLFGITVPSFGNFFTTATYIITHLYLTNMPTLVLSIILMGLAIVVQRRLKMLPMSLVLLVGATLASAIFNFSDKGIATIGMIPTGLPLPKWPTITFYDLQNLIVPALAISLVSYANTIATARTFAVHQKESIEAPQEFFGLGVSNIGSGIFGGIPVAASGARTAVNHENKAVTQVSQLFGALSIAIVLLVFAPLLRFLPLSALAVIIIMAVQKLFNYNELKSIWRAWQSEAVLAIVTLVGVTVLGIFQGLLLAVFLAVMNLVRKSSFPQDAVLGIAEDGSVRDMSRPPKTIAIPGIVIYRFDAPLYFANANYFKERVNRLIEDSDEPVKWFLWDAETITAFDSTSGQMLLNLINELKTKDITFAVARMKGPIRHTINQSRRLSRALRASPHFTSIGDALDAFNEQLKVEDKDESQAKNKT